MYPIFHTHRQKETHVRRRNPPRKRACSRKRTCYIEFPLMEQSCFLGVFLKNRPKNQWLNLLRIWAMMIVSKATEVKDAFFATMLLQWKPHTTVELFYERLFLSSSCQGDINTTTNRTISSFQSKNTVVPQDKFSFLIRLWKTYKMQSWGQWYETLSNIRIQWKNLHLWA